MLSTKISTKKKTTSAVLLYSENLARGRYEMDLVISGHNKYNSIILML